MKLVAITTVVATLILTVAAGAARAQSPATAVAPPPAPEAPLSPPPPPAIEPAPTTTPPPAADDDGAGAMDPIDPNIYIDALDTDVAYDDAVAQSYDDGYDPQAAAQFSDALAPYGTWIDDGTYGQVWMPSPLVVGAGFAPYDSNGRWALTEYGWTWVSGYPWGWAPFHYGRWAVLGRRGWCWIPGTLWGPAWVSWRAGGGYVGWAALPPRGVRLGRPVGPGSPWRFTAAARLGAPVPAYVPARAVPSVFPRTFVVSTGRVLGGAAGGVRVNAGPTRLLNEHGAPIAAAPFHTVAPHAAPAVAIRAHAGVALAARPWMGAGVHVQAPVTRWPAGARAVVASPTMNAMRVGAVPTGPGGVPRGNVWGNPGWGGAVRAGMAAPTYAAPIARPFTGAGIVARPWGRPAAPFAARPAPAFVRPAPWGSPAWTARPMVRSAPAPMMRAPSFGGGSSFSHGSSFGGGHAFGGGSSFSHGSSFGGGHGFGGGGHFGGGGRGRR